MKFANQKSPSQNMGLTPGCCTCPQENNFKAVLESMRDLMNEQTIVPPWLHDTFLGYGSPNAAQYTQLPDFRRTVDFKVQSCLDLNRG